MDYTAIGDTTNLAARLQQLAEPGAILASEATWRLVEGYVRGERVGPVQVKGRSEPVVVVRLLGPGRAGRRSRAWTPQGLSHFVGRDRELETLLALFAAPSRRVGARPSGSSASPVSGSRASCSSSAIAWRVAGSPTSQGRCLSYGAAIPYVPVVDTVRANCGIG